MVPDYPGAVRSAEADPVAILHCRRLAVLGGNIVRDGKAFAVIAFEAIAQISSRSVYFDAGIFREQQVYAVALILCKQRRGYSVVFCVDDYHPLHFILECFDIVEEVSVGL